MVRAAGAEFEAEISFSALHQLLLPLLDGIEELRPLYRDALSVALGLGEGRPPDRLVVAGAALELMRRAGQEQPLLIVLDDVFWMDRPSAEVLGFVARRLARSHVGLLAALRTATGSVFDGSGLPQVPARAAGLGNGGPTCARAVPDPRCGHAPASARRGGRQSARAARAAGGAERAPAVCLSGSAAVLPLSARLSELFASRVESCQPRHGGCCCSPCWTTPATCRRCSGQPETPSCGTWRPPSEAGWSTSIRRLAGLVFRHPLTRSAVVELSTAQERRAAHRALAGVRPEEPQRLAWHLAEASIGPDERVAEMLEACARQMLGSRRPGGRGERPDARGRAQPGRRRPQPPADQAAFVGVNMAGRLGDSEEIVAEALEAEPGPGASTQADVTAAFVLLNGDGDLESVHRLLVRAIEAQGDELDATDEDVAAAIYLLLLVCGFACRADLWARFFAILDRLRPRVPEDLLLASLTTCDPVRGAVGVLDRLDQAIADLSDESDFWHRRKVTLAAVSIDRLGGCRQAMRRMVESARETGAWTLVVSALNFMCLDSFLTGDWDELEQLLAECFEICEHAGLRLYVPTLRYDRALLAAARGEDALARELADAITGWALPRGADLIAQFASHARGLAALGRGDFEQAYHHASAVCPPGEFPRYARHALWVCMDLVEAAVRTDRHAEAAAHVAAMHRYGIARISSRIALLAGGSAGLAARNDQAALAAFEQALAIPGADRWPFDLARVRLVYGERLRRARSGRGAGAQLAAALEAFQRLGATPWVSRAAAELRASGQAPAAASTNGSAEPLTPQEHEIASLAAAGLTNKQIGERLYLSHRTVSGHLYRIFPKLGISTRAALRDALPS